MVPEGRLTAGLPITTSPAMGRQPFAVRPPEPEREGPEDDGPARLDEQQPGGSPVPV